MMDLGDDLRFPDVPTLSATIVEVPFRGRTVAMEPSVLGVLTLALLALEDPKVDAVLSAFRVVMTDTNGNRIWPEPA